ncbi:Exodeoxyribonuclease 7 small subunit [bioreactor metagenome]|uniref:Exodeoxyribonuclease 7 small subunit n=1 Tax=bioreactor metagenome TaxID=1076179 RepID=A0A645HYY5_9ZZZZ|nr:exodeoxyribonuclease VII small subunit [Oscillospiraceae bacterium]
MAEMKFEEAMAKLEAIVKSLESQTAPLDETLKLFEEGVGLVKICNQMLDDASKRIKILTRSQSGEIGEADFNPQ